MLKQPRTPLRSAHSSSDLHWRGSHWIRLRRKQRQRRVQSLFQNSCLGWKRGAVCMQLRLWSELGTPNPSPPGPFPGGAGLSAMGLEFATGSSREAGSIQTLHPLHVTQMPNNMQFSLYWFQSRIWESLRLDCRTNHSQPTGMGSCQRN